MVRFENEALRFSSFLKCVLGRRVALEMSVVFRGYTARERVGNIGFVSSRGNCRNSALQASKLYN